MHSLFSLGIAPSDGSQLPGDKAVLRRDPCEHGSASPEVFQQPSESAWKRVLPQSEHEMTVVLDSTWVQPLKRP